MVATERRASMQSSRRISDYREDEIPAELYDDRSSRFSDASLFLRSADGTERGNFPWRTSIIAALLFVVGLTFLLLGLLHFRSYDNQTFIALVVLGSISFIPGAYATFNIIQWYRGVPGFHLSEFAHWDDYRT